MSKTLNLTLKKLPFEVMITGEKKIEYRKPSKWIESRLFDKELNIKPYDYIKFSNGYSKNSPYFICLFGGVGTSITESEIKYSNGLIVNKEEGDYKIYLGEIIEKGNI